MDRKLNEKQAERVGLCLFVKAMDASESCKQWRISSTQTGTCEAEGPHASHRDISSK